MSNISTAKLSAEKNLAYILNKLRNHEQIIKFYHEEQCDGWRKMKYARGLFDRSIGFISSNEENIAFIKLIQPFHCKLKTSSKVLFDELKSDYKIDFLSLDELFGTCDIIIIQGPLNDFTDKITKNQLEIIKSEALVLLQSKDIQIDDEYFISCLKDKKINAVVYDDISFSSSLNSLMNVIVAQ